MRLAGLRATVSARFYLVVVLMVIVLFTGMSTGFPLFYRLLYVLALTLVLSYVWTWFAIRSLDVKAERITRQVRVGENIEEVIGVRNQAGLPKHALEVDDLTDLPGYSGGMVISLKGHGFSSWRVQAPARKRGVYTLGPVRVASMDPFGLFRRYKVYGDSDMLTILPYTFNVSGFDIPAADLMGESSFRRRTHQVTPHASSVREYATGDALSRVHWNSTARLGKLMSKEFDLGRAGEVWVLVDLHRDVQAGELEESTDEYAVSIGASLAKRYLEAQEPVGLVAYGDQRYFLEADTGTGQLERIMQYLAVSKAEGITPLETVLPQEEALWSSHSSLVVITASPRTEWVVALEQLAKRGARVVVVLVDGSSFGGFFNTQEVADQAHLAGLPSYVIRQGDDLPIALSHKYGGGGVAPGAEVAQVGAIA